MHITVRRAGIFASCDTSSHVSRRSIESSAIGIALVLLIFVAAVPVHASQVSIPIIGRYSTLVIPLYIPAYPKWAHDVVLNASIAWNNAELWQNQNNSSALFYTFVEADEETATSTISFNMPQAYAGIAVGWTNYNFAASSRTIVGTQTFLDPSAFNESREGNVTAWRYAFRLALHELGRIQGLGSVLDGQDIMDPICTPQQVKEAPKLSTLNLFALHILALGNSPQFVTLPAGEQNQLIVAAHFLRRSVGENPQDALPVLPASDSVQLPTSCPSILLSTTSGQSPVRPLEYTPARLSCDEAQIVICRADGVN